MAKNKTSGDKPRKGAAKSRPLSGNPLTGTWTKRDDKSGKFMDLKAVPPKPFKGVRGTERAFSIKIADPAVKLDKKTSAKIRRAVLRVGGASNPLTGTWTRKAKAKP